MRHAGRWCAAVVFAVVVGGCEAVEDVGPLLDELEAVQAQVRGVVDSNVAATRSGLAAAEEAGAAIDRLQDELRATAWRPGLSDERAQARTDSVRATGALIMARRRHNEAAAVAAGSASRHGELVRRLREAYQDGTWDLIADASPRSIVMGALRDAEQELRRVEAGCSPLPQLGGDDCAIEVVGDE